MSESMTVTLAVAQILLDVIGALMLFIMNGMRADVKENTLAISALQKELARDYATRNDLKELRQGYHDAIDKRVAPIMAGLELRILELEKRK